LLFKKKTIFNQELFEEFASKKAANILSHLDSGTDRNRIETIDVTLLEVDITKFSISGDYGQQELMKHMNVYHEAVGEVVHENQGEIISINGDSVLSYFHDTDLEKAAGNAATAALALVAASENRLSNSRIQIGLSIGINSDVVGIGIFGSKYRRQIGCFGQARNLCGRLMSTNNLYHTNVILSEFAEARLPAQFDRREMDILHVKGLDKPMRIFELVNVNDTANKQ